MDSDHCRVPVDRLSCCSRLASRELLCYSVPWYSIVPTLSPFWQNASAAAAFVIDSAARRSRPTTCCQLPMAALTTSRMLSRCASIVTLTFIRTILSILVVDGSHRKNSASIEPSGSMSASSHNQVVGCCRRIALHRSARSRRLSTSWSSTGWLHQRLSFVNSVVRFGMTNFAEQSVTVQLQCFVPSSRQPS